MSGHALLDVVTESLVAFPQEAHLKVFQFLSDAGASEKEKIQVQQAWTRVAMAGEAFGQKNRPRDPLQFGREFVKELGVGRLEIAKLEETTASFRALVAAREANERSGNKKDQSSTRIASLHDLKKSNGVLSSLQSMTKVGKDLSAAQASVYPSSGRAGDGGAEGLENSVLIHRRYCRNAKFTLNGRKPANASPLYSPLSVKDLGVAEVSYGEATFKHGISAKPDSLPVVGIKVVSKQPSVHSRAYCTYQCLHEVLPKGPERLRLFPAPLGILKPAEQAGPTPVFELPLCRPLLPLLGMTLSAYLRKYPSVPLHWCAQVGASLRAFRNCQSGWLMRMPTLHDVFVAENGTLMLGNVVFEECDSGSESSVDLAGFFSTLLASVLSLSRSVPCLLQPSLGGAGPAVATPESEEAVAEAARHVDAAEEVISVIEGSTLRLNFRGHSCNSVSVQPAGRRLTAFSSADLQVHLLGEDAIASVTGHANSGVTDVIVQARSPGSVMLRVVAPASGSSDSRVKFLALDVRVVVVPAYPIQSAALQEVAAQLQASFVSKNNDMFLSAHAVRLDDARTGQPGAVAEEQLLHDEVRVHGDWTEIRLQLDQHLSRTGGKPTR
jgi:hypothetical protein